MIRNLGQIKPNNYIHYFPHYEDDHNLHLYNCYSCKLFDGNEDFVGEIVSERFFVLRHKFCKGDYGEEKQVVED